MISSPYKLNASREAQSNTALLVLKPLAGEFCKNSFKTDVQLTCKIGGLTNSICLCYCLFTK